MTQALRERPIIFSGEMCMAILGNRKTQTRRLIKPQPVRSLPNTKPLEGGDGTWEIHRPLGWRWQKSKDFSVYTADKSELSFGENLARHCPYGVAGDRLWVKETWLPDAPINGWSGDIEWDGCGRPAKGVPDRYRSPEHCLYAASWSGHEISWKSPLFMPRWASRLTLEITGVRVERVQDISEADAIAEGIRKSIGGMWCGAPHKAHGFPKQQNTAREAFADLWDHINGKRAPWASNPFCWVISFRRVADAVA